jgi:hypothetical protein
MQKQYVSVTFIQYAQCMRCIILSSLASLALPHFSTLSLEMARFFGKKFIEHKTCVWIFSTILSETVLIPRKIE